MLVIIGYLIVLLSVFGGFALAGGHLGAMIQPVEFLIIGGAALGAFVVSNSGKVLKATVRALPLLFKGPRHSKARYLALMGLLYAVLNKIRREGLISLEREVDAPGESALFTPFPEIMADPHLMEFLTDYLRLMVSGNLNPIEIESLMDSEIETFHQEASIPANAIQRVGEALPAFGIVAAVMGVVKTMGSVGLPPAELGLLIAQALVGTFLGILLSYGFVSPLASLIEHKVADMTKQLECVKVTLLASMNGYAPQLAVEFGRKVLYSTERPSFTELDGYVRASKTR